MTNKTPLCVYIAGPMRGYELSNFPAFDACRDHLQKRGWEAISPADMDRTRDHFDPTSPRFDPAKLGTFDLRRALRRDFAAIMDCDGIVFLPGWEASLGANAERTLGEALGLKCWLYLPTDRIKVRKTTWAELEDARFAHRRAA